MRKNCELTGFILLIIGTIGLLINEFIFDWGRIAVLIFAVVNIVGLVIVVPRLRKGK